MSTTTSSTSAVIKPPEFDRPDFRRRRTENWVVLGLLYMFFYMTRYNFSASAPALTAYFGWSNTQYGIFETAMPFVYGLSVFLNGPVADRIGGRRTFLFGAVGVTAMNFVFGACIKLVSVPAVVAVDGKTMHVVTPAVLRFGLSSGTLLALMVVVWGINGFFQSFGALSIVKVNAQWFHVRERGTFSGVFGVLIRAGLILATSGVPLITGALSLAWGFWIPGACVAVLFVVNYFVMRDSPKDAGFGDMDTGDGSSAEGDKAPTLAFVLRKVFANPAAWTIAFASMMIGVVRRSTIDSWAPKYFGAVHLPPGRSLGGFAPYQLAAWGIGLLGIAGGFMFGIASDRVFQGRRAPVITFGFIGMTVMLVLFGLSDQMNLGPWAAAMCLAPLSLFVNGAHGMIGGAASMDFGGRKAAGTAAGLFDGIQYLFSAPIVGLGVGKIVDRWGWGVWHWVPVPFAVVGAILMVRLWNVTPAGGKRAS